MLGQGDRVGVCLAGLDAGCMERGLACAPGSVPTFSTACALVRRVRYYRSPVDSFVKLHVSIGHATVMATAIFFGAREAAEACAAGVATQPALGGAAVEGGGGAPSAPRVRARRYAAPGGTL